MKTELKTLKDLEEWTFKEIGFSGVGVEISELREEAIKWAKELRKLDILYSEKTISTKELMKLASSPLGKFMIVDGVIEGEYALWSINVVDFIMHFFNLTEKDLE